MPPRKDPNQDYDLSDIWIDDDEEQLLNDHHRLIEVYLERLDANARRLNKKTVCERVVQGAIRDMIKHKGFDSKIEVMPGRSTLRRMDIYGDLIPGRQFVVEVKMGFDNFIGGVAQLNYYCHLLTQAGNKPTSLILAFHDEDAEKVPFDIVDFCDSETIFACKAEEAAEIVASQREQIIRTENLFSRLGSLETNTTAHKTQCTPTTPSSPSPPRQSAT